MMPTTQKQKGKISSVGGEKTHKEVIACLDACKPVEYNKKVLDRIKQLDKHLGNICHSIDVILVGGTNGKSSTIHFASKLLKEEGYKVGAAYASHILTYNERVSVDFTKITNKDLTAVLNEVIAVAHTNKIEATAFELMMMASLIHFKAQHVDVALFEVGMGGLYDATQIFEPKISAITRIAQEETDVLGEDLDKVTFETLEIAKKGTWLVSAEQSKIRLNKMKKWAEDSDVKWAMPIRKLAALPYIHEQLYGRSASLGERIAQIYVEDIKEKFSPFLRGNLLATQKGQRGRPTLQAKRKAELNPIKTLQKFWSEEFDLLPGRFELLNKEKPSMLLDNADNIDALTNLFLGVRLLHYQKPIKDLTLIVGLPTWLKTVETIKLIRYLLKKVNGQVLFVPITKVACHKPKDLEDTCKELGVKGQACASFGEAFELAKKTVDEREGLVVVTGHQNIISAYWKYRGIKKV